MTFVTILDVFGVPGDDKDNLNIMVMKAKIEMCK